MFVLALVLIAVGAAVVVIGLLALGHRLPRNRVVGVRTPWTMSRVDTFRRANRAAAPGLVASGAIGVAGGGGAACSSGVAAVTLLALGVVGLLLLLAAAGMIGVRYAIADEAAQNASSAPSGPCTLDPEPCAQSGPSCAGSCWSCPHAGQPG